MVLLNAGRLRPWFCKKRIVSLSTENAQLERNKSGLQFI
jgi:hypothetical protein